jgi:nicotinate (nicotinamide) nucleotide adenylyltransferase
VGLTSSQQSGSQPKRRPRSIGVFGGSFDPIHNGHLAAAEFALKAARVDEVLIVPAADQWLRPRALGASGQHRLRMAELAVAGHDGLTVSRVDIDRPGSTYTVDTMHDLRRQYGEGVEFVLILGADSALSLPAWNRVEELVKLCKLFVVGRPGEKWPLDLPAGHPAAGAEFAEGPMVFVSATDIRRRLSSARSVRGMLPQAVEDYIKEHDLYDAASVAEFMQETGIRPLPWAERERSGQSSIRGQSSMLQTDTRAERLLERAKELGALRFGDFTLTSGQKSAYYFDGRQLSLDPEGAELISSLFFDQIARAGCAAFGGPTVAAVPIVGALALRCWHEKASLTGFFVRPEAKKHGMGRQIEGSVKPGMTVAVFDDTVSTGGSLLAAIDAVQEFGCEVGLVLCVLDRKQGGSDEVKRRGLPFVSLWEATPQGEIRVVRR